MNERLYYNFPDNGCKHEKYSKSKCEWEMNGKQKYNYIMECDKCHMLAETPAEFVTK